MTQNLALGIDIGGTNTAYGLVNRRGEILEKGSFSTKKHTQLEDYLSTFANTLLPIIEHHGIEKFSGIGIGAPNGNYHTGEILFAPNLPWKGRIPLSKFISEKCGLKTVLTNDANAAAIGEMTFGAAKGIQDFIMITLGTGVGSGVVVNGRLVYGHDGFAGELGHVIVHENGRLCGCERRGCLETYCSAGGVVETAKHLKPNYPDSILLKTDSENWTAKNIFDGALTGDDLALKVFDETAKTLGLALANAVAFSSPKKIILFGGLVNSGPILMTPLKTYFENNLLAIYKNKVELIPSALPENDAAILGASALAW